MNEQHPNSKPAQRRCRDATRAEHGESVAGCSGWGYSSETSVFPSLPGSNPPMFAPDNLLHLSQDVFHSIFSWYIHYKLNPPYSILIAKINHTYIRCTSTSPPPKYTSSHFSSASLQTPLSLCQRLCFATLRIQDKGFYRASDRCVGISSYLKSVLACIFP